MDTLRTTLNKIPTLPAAVQDVIASFDNADIEVQALAEKISQDQGLSAKILRVANSTFYGLPRQVGSISNAVVVLGFSTVRSLALAAGIAGVFPASSATFSWPGYWRRSMAAAVYARALAKCLKLNPEIAFTAGLFHDIGLAALAFGAPQQLAAAQAAAGTGDLLAAERALLGFDHAVLGGEVARLWCFPPAIEHAIRHHHDAAAGEGEPLFLVTHAASLLSLAAADGVAPDMEGCLPQPLLAALGLGPEQMCSCMPHMDEIMAACAALLSP